MPSSGRSARLVYIITANGEVGPCRIDEIRERYRNGEFGLHDMVRSGFGAMLGTVDDLLSGRVSDGSTAQRELGIADTVTDNIHRRQSLVWLGLSTALVVAAIMGFIALRPSKNVTLPLTVPSSQVELTVNTATGDGHSVNVDLSERIAEPVAIRLHAAPPVAGVQMDPPEASVSLAAGQTRATIRFRCERSDPRPVPIRVHAGFTRGTTAITAKPLDLMLSDTRPTAIACEPFMAPDLSLGWATRWSGPVHVIGEPLTRDATSPMFGITSYGQLSGEGGGWVQSDRRLAIVHNQGHLWMTFVIMPVAQLDGGYSWCEFKFTGHVVGGIGIGIQRKDGKYSWYFMAEKPPPNQKQTFNRQFSHPLMPVRIVIRLDLSDRETSAFCWVDPPADREPDSVEAHSLLSIPPIAIGGARIGCSSGCVIRVADLRIGTTWEQVRSRW